MDLAGKYEGDILDGRYHGRGVYTCQECTYEGSFFDGKFHGEGVLRVQGGSYKGYWRHGELVDGGLVFEDGLQHLKVGFKFWDYCSPQDRRFYKEIQDGVPVLGPLRDVTSHAHGSALPIGCYDTVDGYYEPRRHMIMSYEKNEEIRAPDPEEIDFILTTCRVGK